MQDADIGANNLQQPEWYQHWDNRCTSAFAAWVKEQDDDIENSFGKFGFRVVAALTVIPVAGIDLLGNIASFAANLFGSFLDLCFYLADENPVAEYGFTVSKAFESLDSIVRLVGTAICGIFIIASDPKKFVRLVDARDTLVQLQAQLQTLRNNQAEIGKKLAEVQKENGRLQQSCFTINEFAKRATEENEAIKAKFAEMTKDPESVGAVKMQNLLLFKAHSEAIQKAETNEARAKSYEESYFSYEKEAKELIQELEEKNKQLNSENEALKKAIETPKKEHQTLQESMTKMTEDLQSQVKETIEKLVKTTKNEINKDLKLNLSADLDTQ